MKIKLNGYLIGITEWQDWDDYENYIFDDDGMIKEKYSGYNDTPSKDEYDRICAELSGDVVVRKIR